MIQDDLQPSSARLRGENIIKESVPQKETLLLGLRCAQGAARGKRRGRRCHTHDKYTRAVLPGIMYTNCMKNKTFST